MSFRNPHRSQASVGQNHSETDQRIKRQSHLAHPNLGYFNLTGCQLITPGLCLYGTGFFNFLTLISIQA